MNGECGKRRVSFADSRSAGIVDAPVPVPGPGQFLVRTEAVGVGIAMVRMLKSGDPARPGGEMVGTVVAVGHDGFGFGTGFEHARWDTDRKGPGILPLVRSLP